MAVVDLSKLDWIVEGWRPFAWKQRKTAETNFMIVPDVGPFPAQVPGSVQEALLRAGAIPDWNVGVNSRFCEWVEHRHWLFEAVIPAGTAPAGERVELVAQGLDYSGWIAVDMRDAGCFSGTLLPHRFDLTEFLGDGKEHRLAIVFEEPPREQGQFGYTSRSHFFKPRYNYSWDWCPRIVPTGVWDALTLETGPGLSFRLRKVDATLIEDFETGRIEVAWDLDNGGGLDTVTVVVRDGKGEVGSAQARADEGRLTLDGLRVAPWWPNGAGEQTLYTVEVTARGTAAEVTERRTVGFRRIEWRACEGAPESAEPWICVVNGVPVFLQGANWVPTRAVYHEADEDDYRTLIGLYREMGANILRVWGGGILEKEAFYRACDEAGIFVWQEFPLSSSGIENVPPRDPEAIAQIEQIAATYIRRRGHHASLLLWSGGNELYYEEPGQEPSSIPVDYAHPCIAALQAVVVRDDAGRRFLPGSPSGPIIYAQPENYGKGLHHDIHGPWGMGANPDLEEWRKYWAGDDALFRSETGMPGAASLDALYRYSGGMPVWPPQGEHWFHTAAWWTQWGEGMRERLAGLDEKSAVAEYVRYTREFQAQAYAIAASACKDRFPRCGGFIIWMGHDCFPCPANNSVIEFDRSVKPAYHALKEVFRR
jgi:beta-mannosidase